MSNLIFSESSADPLKQEMVNDYLAQIAPSSFANTSILLLALGPILVFFFCALLVAFCKADKSVVQKKQILIGFTLCWSLVAIYGTSISSSVYAVSVKNQDIASFIHQSMFCIFACNSSR